MGFGSTCVAVVALAALTATSTWASSVSAEAATSTKSLTWHLTKDYGTAMLHGKATYSTGEQTLEYYTRLPASAEKTTRPSIWGLSQDPAGMIHPLYFFVPPVSPTSVRLLGGLDCCPMLCTETFATDMLRL